MRNPSRLITALAFAILASVVPAQEMPAPEKEHEWLQKFVGEWDAEAEMKIPGMEGQKCKGTEKVRSLGGYWIISEGKGTLPGGSGEMHSVMTVGWDPKRKTYFGTWVDSMTSHLWNYLGTVDAAGKVLTLEAEGPDMSDPARTAKYRDAIEFKSADHKVMTSTVQGADGKWTTMAVVNYRRKK